VHVYHSGYISASVNYNACIDCGPKLQANTTHDPYEGLDRTPMGHLGALYEEPRDRGSLSISQRQPRVSGLVTFTDRTEAKSRR